MNQICEEPQTSNLNLSIIPINSKKLPTGEWKQYQTELSPVYNWHAHYLNRGYVGIICGAVSDYLECVDVDIKNDPKGTINYGMVHEPRLSDVTKSRINSPRTRSSKAYANAYEPRGIFTRVGNINRRRRKIQPKMQLLARILQFHTSAN